MFSFFEHVSKIITHKMCYILNSNKSRRMTTSLTEPRSFAEKSNCNSLFITHYHHFKLLDSYYIKPTKSDNGAAK